MNDYLGLYLHIPFCRQKCAYCDFYSVPTQELWEDYTDALLLHMQDYSAGAANRLVDSVFIGGGTPTVLPAEMMGQIIRGARDLFNLTDDVEFTMECNPATATLRDLKKYRRAGVNRLSIGVQSANDAELKELGRIHTWAEAEQCFRDARKAGFTNINLDLMYGIPGQTPESLKATLEEAVALEPTHISLYNLILEEGTPFWEKKDSLVLPDEDTEYEMYSGAVLFLEGRGYHQYEISNFAKDGYQCRHNLKYWNCEEYLGLGAAAHSYYNERRFSFKRDLKLYTDALHMPDSGMEITDESYDVRPADRIGEYVMLRMRLKEGVDTRVFAERFGLDFERMYGKYLKLYVENGYMTHTDTRYAFTLKGMYVSNYILSEMIDFDSPVAKGIADGSDRVCGEKKD